MSYLISKAFTVVTLPPFIYLLQLPFSLCLKLLVVTVCHTSSSFFIFIFLFSENSFLPDTYTADMILNTSIISQLFLCIQYSTSVLLYTLSISIRSAFSCLSFRSIMLILFNLCSQFMPPRCYTNLAPSA